MYNFPMPTLEGSELSERELDILRLVATGASNKEIAHQLFISPNTVKVHLRNIFTKIGVLSRTEAAMYAVHIGLVPGGSPPVVSLSDEQAYTGLSPLEQTDHLPSSTILPTAQADSPPNQSSKIRLWIALALLALLLSLTGIGLAWFSRQDPKITPTSAVQPAVMENATPTAMPRWQALPNLSTPRRGLALVAYDGRLYAIGGETARGISGLLEVYDPTAQVWTRQASKPLPSADLQAVVLGGKIYVPGGRLEDGKPTNKMEIFDPLTNTWAPGPDLPFPVSGYALAAFEGKMYLFGGWNGNQATAGVLEYDPSLASWRQVTPMPTARAFSAAAVAGGKIYVVGGFDGKSTLTTSEAYNPSLEASSASPWSTAPPLPQGRWGMGAAGIADTLLIIGGASAPPGTLISEATPAAYQFFPSQDAWTLIEQPGEQLWTGLSAASLEQYVYAVGGTLSGAITSQVQAYQAVYTVLIPIIR